MKRQDFVVCVVCVVCIVLLIQNKKAHIAVSLILYSGPNWNRPSDKRIFNL